MSTVLDSESQAQQLSRIFTHCPAHAPPDSAGYALTVPGPIGTHVPLFVATDESNTTVLGTLINVREVGSVDMPRWVQLAPALQCMLGLFEGCEELPTVCTAWAASMHATSSSGHHVPSYVSSIPFCFLPSAFCPLAAHPTRCRIPSGTDVPPTTKPAFSRPRKCCT